MESRTGFNPVVAVKCNRAEVPERQGAGTRELGDEGQVWGGHQLRGSGTRSQGSGEGTDKRAEDNWAWEGDAHSLGCGWWLCQMRTRHGGGQAQV